MTDEELLAVVADERRRSVGFDHDDDLLSQREKAHNYFKGVMPDVPSLPNRSKAVSTDVADAIETLLPDLVEIFTGGDDVVTFIPVGQEDEQQAKQETDYLNQVVFQENGGFLTLYTMFKDALLDKTGVVKFWWEDNEAQTETLTGKSEEEAAVALQTSEVVDISQGEDGYDLEIKKPGPVGRVCIEPVPPEDLTVAKDTILLSTATYCAVRSRPRAQQLIAKGIAREIVDSLPGYESAKSMDDARDTASESEHSSMGLGDLREVEVVDHYIRLEEGGRLQLWRVMTGGGETVLIEKEKIDRINLAAITAFVVTHRFYGLSVADLLMEIQRINTALTRGYLDSIYFALNQRAEVAMDKANEYTLSDLLRNEPGVPIRSRTGDAIKPVQAGGAGFNGLDALEYFATKAEQRTGIVRNAQGLNPDTLHDTKGGMERLMGAAQKRVRLIARIFAETGIKDLFLGVHALLRQHSTQQVMMRRRGTWEPIDPSSWGSRSDMSIEIGVGSGGKAEELIAIQAEFQVMTSILEMQGGPTGPIVTLDNVYAMARRFYEKNGCKAPEAYLTDPKQAPPQEPKPDPKMMEVQGKLQLEEQKAQVTLQLEQQRFQAQGEFEREKASIDLQLAQDKHAAELQMQRERMQMDDQFKREQAAAELQLKREEMQLEAEVKMEVARHSAEVSAKVSGPQMGGEPG